MKIKVAYENKKDKELLELNQSTTPYFIEYIDVTTKTGLKDSYKLKSLYGARLNPFIVVYDDEDKFVQCFWSENGNAVQQFINWLLNNDSKN